MIVIVSAQNVQVVIIIVPIRTLLPTIDLLKLGLGELMCVGKLKKTVIKTKLAKLK